MNPDPLGLFPTALALIAYLLTVIGVALFLVRGES